MKAKCPHCHTVYEVSANEIGQEGICEKCGKPFVIGTANATTKKRVVLPPQSKMQKSRGEHPRSKRFVWDDVMFISPTIAKILQWVGYVAALCVAGAQLLAVLTAGMSDSGIFGILMIPIVLIGLIVAILLVRMWYEFVVAIFEIVRHLREIRMNLYSSEQ